MGELSNTTINGVSYDLKDAGAARQSHSHTKSQITDFPTSMPASDVPAWAKASSKPTYTQDEVSDGSTYKRVTSTEKTTWNGKGTYSKPSGGIPKTDLASAVQTLLDGIPSPPSGLTGLKTLNASQITNEEGGFANYGPIVFIADTILVPSGEAMFMLFNIRCMAGDPYPENAPLPPFITVTGDQTETGKYRLPIYGYDAELIPNSYLELSYRKTSTGATYNAIIYFGTTPTTDTIVRLNFDYIGMATTWT